MRLISAGVLGCFVLLQILCQSTASRSDGYYLANGETFKYEPIRGLRLLRTFCYAGRPKYIIHLWQSVILDIVHSTNDYDQYEASTPDEVVSERDGNRLSWSLNLFSFKQKHLKLNPFNQSCIGIESYDGYTVTLQVIRIDYWKVLYLIAGITLFLSSDKLSRNTFFYYLCGVTLGVCTSFLILIYFLSKLFPRKPLMYGVAACGWTIGIYLFQLLWDNVRVIIVNYRTYLLWYTVITGFVSLIICYWWGPIENKRTRNIIRWTLQTASLLTIYQSTQFQEAAMGQIVILLLFYNLPRSWLSKPKKYWKTKFPPKVKLLSNDDYYKQGVLETSKALKDLREYCSSPDCKQWQVALKLKDVKRFASFMEGNSHLSDDEILEYETSVHGSDRSDLTDDDTHSEEEEEL